jgi:hypothetical protein
MKIQKKNPGQQKNSPSFHPHLKTLLAGSEKIINEKKNRIIEMILRRRGKINLKLKLC